MNNPWLDIKKDIAKKTGLSINDIEEPENYGDLAVPCFLLAKKFKKSPVDIAQELSAKLKIKNIEKIQATGPYINFYIDKELFAKELLKSVNSSFGKAKSSEKIMMDVFQANPFKSFHIGHIRNAVLGESIRRILEFRGNKTYAVNYNGDVGIHVARWLTFYKKHYKGKIPKDNFTKWVGDIYVKASALGKKSKLFQKEAQEMNLLLDKRDPKIIKEWKKLRDLCYKDYERIRKELDIKVDKVIPESECEKPGKDLINKLYKSNKIKKSEGAVGIDLGKNGFFILLKTDGTSIYATKDLGLLQLKKKYKKFDKMVYVVGSEQEFYFKQLFETFDRLNLYPEKKSIHVSYGEVMLTEGKMSSRKGNIIVYADLKNEMKKSIKKQFKVKNDKLAEDIAFGAIKFYMLIFDNKKKITFDWDQALDVEGKSGPYLQYTYARASSISKKVRTAGKSDLSLLNTEAEFELIKKMALFPQAVEKSAKDYDPSTLANYLFELAQKFNSFYNSSPVLKSEKDLRNARLVLVKKTMIVLETGLNLLGIKPLKKM